MGVTWPPTLEDIPESSHGRDFCKNFRSVYVVEGVSGSHMNQFLNRLDFQTSIQRLLPFVVFEASQVLRKLSNFCSVGKTAKEPPADMQLWLA